MPGGPESKTPFGNLPPSFVNKSGFFRYSTISCSSAFASSHPLTSSNVLRDCSLIAPASYSFGSNEDLPAGSPPTPGSEGRFPAGVGASRKQPGGARRPETRRSPPHLRRFRKNPKRRSKTRSPHRSTTSW